MIPQYIVVGQDTFTISRGKTIDTLNFICSLFMIYFNYYKKLGINCNKLLIQDGNKEGTGIGKKFL